MRKSFQIASVFFAVFVYAAVASACGGCPENSPYSDRVDAKHVVLHFTEFDYVMTPCQILEMTSKQSEKAQNCGTLTVRYRGDKSPVKISGCFIPGVQFREKVMTSLHKTSCLSCAGIRPSWKSRKDLKPFKADDRGCPKDRPHKVKKPKHSSCF